MHVYMFVCKYTCICVHATWKPDADLSVFLNGSLSLSRSLSFSVYVCVCVHMCVRACVHKCPCHYTCLEDKGQLWGRGCLAFYLPEAGSLLLILPCGSLLTSWPTSFWSNPPASTSQLRVGALEAQTQITASVFLSEFFPEITL